MLDTGYTVVCQIEPPFSRGTYVATNVISVADQHAFVFERRDMLERTTGLATSFSSSEMSFLYKTLNEFESDDHVHEVRENCHVKQSQYLLERLLDQLFPVKIHAQNGVILLVESSQNFEHKIKCVPRKFFKILMTEGGKCFERPKIFFFKK